MDQAVGSLIAFGVVAWLLAFVLRTARVWRRAKSFDDLMRSRYGRARDDDYGDAA